MLNTTLQSAKSNSTLRLGETFGVERGRTL